MTNLNPMKGNGASYETIGENTATTTYTTVTAAGSANTKGSYVELVASSGITAEGFLLTIENTSGNRNYLIDIATGAAASETVLLSNFFVSFGALVSWVTSIYIPLGIVSGTRISARIQSNVASQALRLGCTLISDTAASGSYGQTETWGADTSDSAGTAITSGQNDAKGSYSQIVASSTRQTDAIIISLGAGDFAHGANNEILLDVATGGAGSETVLIPNMYFLGDVFEDCFRPAIIGPIPCDIPAGSRVAVRCQDTDTTVEAFDVAIMSFTF